MLFAGLDVITVATNHAQDCGTLGWNCEGAALRDTLAHLAGAGIAAVGGGEDLATARLPVVIERNGVRFAFLGVTQVGPETWAGEGQTGTAPLSDEALPDLLADIAAAHAKANVVIVLPQWGIEYSEQPTSQQRDWAAAMVSAGAALIIGNHPHLVQPVEVFTAEDGQAVAAYALGNFIFDQGPWRTRQGALFEATFMGATLVDWRLLPIHIKSLHQPHWADEVEAAAILERMPVLPAR
jgi:poly-gamma-glutamate synthesis protein (capsule biosynthesis protein)